MSRAPGSPQLGVLGVGDSLTFEPVANVLSLLLGLNINVVLLNWDELAVQDPISWPKCDVLLVLSHPSIRLDRVRSYVDRIGAVELNSTQGLELLRDRGAMYRQCAKFGIPVPEWVECYRESYSEPLSFIEETDRVIINGVTIDKPFVEKPRLSEDHAVYVYFPQSAGGGRMRIAKRERSFEPISQVRTQGSFVYQKFVASEGFETKLYAIGTEYVHAEAVPSRINADHQTAGKAIPVYLKPQERLIPVKVGLAFGITVFKVHVLRTQPKNSVLFDISVGRTCVGKKDAEYFQDFAASLVAEIGKRITRNF